MAWQTGRSAVLAVAAAVAGCGTEGAEAPSTPSPPAREARDTARTPAFRAAQCPAGAANCAAATGRVLFVESVDPDGDGDLHVVIAGGSVTGPGITVFDVAKDVRPAKDPRIGDRVTGAGPVYPGSVGQRQIQVTEFRVQR